MPRLNLRTDDLQSHDLRHEATSRLFEQGYSIEQVASVRLHKSWEELKRYTQLKPESLHRGNAGEVGRDNDGEIRRQAFIARRSLDL